MGILRQPVAHPLRDRKAPQHLAVASSRHWTMPPCVRVKRGSCSRAASSVPTKTLPLETVGLPWTAPPSVIIQRTFSIGARALKVLGRPFSVETRFRPGSDPPHWGQSPALALGVKATIPSEKAPISMAWQRCFMKGDTEVRRFRGSPSGLPRVAARPKVRLLDLRFAICTPRFAIEFQSQIANRKSPTSDLRPSRFQLLSPHLLGDNLPG